MYNLCLFVLLRLELNNISSEEQQGILKPLNILPFKYRLLLRFSFFSHKIMYGLILNNVKNSLTPSANPCNILAGTRYLLLSHYWKRLSVFLPIMLNYVLSFIRLDNIHLINFVFFFKYFCILI